VSFCVTVASDAAKTQPHRPVPAGGNGAAVSKCLICSKRHQSIMVSELCKEQGVLFNHAPSGHPKIHQEGVFGAKIAEATEIHRGLFLAYSVASAVS
jgi:hypothetical protein